MPDAMYLPDAMYAPTENQEVACVAETGGWQSVGGGNPLQVVCVGSPPPPAPPSLPSPTPQPPPPPPPPSPAPLPPPSPSPPPLSPPPAVCLDTCGTAGDRVCQDGGWGAFGSMCEFGTDCTDCGPRLLLDPPPSPPVFPPPPPPKPLPPTPSAPLSRPPPSAAGTVLVPGLRHTISFTAAGTIESFDTAGVTASLQSYLQCFEPDCTVELRVTQGSVNVEAVVTDSGGDGSSTATVEAAAALSKESEAGLTKALGVTVQGAVTVSAPSSVMVQVSESEIRAAGPDAIDAGGDEDSGGLIVGAIVGCLALVAALGAGGFYCYKKKKPPPSQPVNVEVVVSSPSSDEGAARGAAAPTEQREAPAMVNQAVLTPAVPLQVVGAPFKDMTLTAVLASCGLEHRTKLFEDEGYTLEVAFRALDSGQSTLMTDLRDLTLTLGECRKLITELKAAKDSEKRRAWF